MRGVLLWGLLGALWTADASAAALNQVRVFSGDGQARLLLVLDGLPTGLSTRSSPALGSIPARGIVVLEGVQAGVQQEGTIPVSRGGIQAIHLTVVGDDLQLSADLIGARSVRAQALGDHAVLIDLIEQGRAGDPTLPTPEQLLAWVQGVSLVTAAGGPPRQRHLVVVDAGHGGKDNGAIGQDGTREADIALQIARRIAKGLREDLDIDVLMTRDTDDFVSLGGRAAMANQADADLFLSIHCNASPPEVARYSYGVETYSLDTASSEGAARVARRENAILQEQGDMGSDPLMANLIETGTNRLSRDLAHEVQSTVIRELSATYGPQTVRDLGTKTALFYVLVSTHMPAILFEANFITNSIEERRLRAPHYQQALASAIVLSVGNWLDRQALDAASTPAPPRRSQPE